MSTVGSLVSVIITCYNQEAFIGQAIESVCNQTYQDWECWIVDDGSTDGSPAICSGYAANDRRIHFIRQQNAGVSSARNNGFSKVKGKYIQFLDGDDWILPQKFEHQVLFMETHPQYGVCYTNHQHYWQTSGNLAQYTFDTVSEHPLMQLLFGYDRGVSIPIHTALLRKNIWKNDDFPFPVDYPHRYEDWVFWVQIAVKEVRFAYLNQSMAVYRMHQQNFINQPETMATNAIQAMIYISRIIPVNLKSDFESSRLEFILSRYAAHKFQSGKKGLIFFKLYKFFLKCFTERTRRLGNQLLKVGNILIRRA